ncbi:hypothetical protein [Ehrlichia ruminantium]|nr:hypothetical protein [Ehrlichia ruminantium]
MLLLLFALIISRIIFYNHNKKVNQNFKITFTDYLSTLKFQHVPKIIVPKKLNDHIIHGGCTKQDNQRFNLQINGYKVHDTKEQTTNKIEKARTQNPKKFHAIENSHRQYILQLTESTSIDDKFKPRIEMAAYLEHIFEQCGQVPQKNLIHELITYLNQGAYLSSSYFVIYRMISKHALNQNVHLTNTPSQVEITVINPHSLRLTIKHDFPIKAIDSEGSVTNKVKYTINSELSFVISSKPNDIFSSISYSQVQMKFNKPKLLSQYFSNSKHEYTKDGHKFIISVKKNRNNIILRTSNFNSPPHTTYLKKTEGYKIADYYSEQHAHRYLDNTTCSKTCTLSR